MQPNSSILTSQHFRPSTLPGEESVLVEQVSLAVYSFYRSDRLPGLIPDLTLVPEEIRSLYILPHMTPESVAARFRQGHRCYVCYRGVDRYLVGWGWVASKYGAIGELGITFELGTEDRYFWDFYVDPLHRRQGIYTQLLQHAMRMEVQAYKAQRLWICHARSNRGSGRGIVRNGWSLLGYLREGPAVDLVPNADHDRARSVAILLGPGPGKTVDIAETDEQFEGPPAPPVVEAPPAAETAPEEDSYIEPTKINLAHPTTPDDFDAVAGIIEVPTDAVPVSGDVDDELIASKPAAANLLDDLVEAPSEEDKNDFLSAPEPLQERIAPDPDPLTDIVFNSAAASQKKKKP